MAPSTTLIRCNSHRARQKLLALVGDAPHEALFSMRRNVGHGGAYRIPTELTERAKSITGCTGLRDGTDLHRCWESTPIRDLLREASTP